MLIFLILCFSIDAFRSQLDRFMNFHEPITTGNTDVIDVQTEYIQSEMLNRNNRLIRLISNIKVGWISLASTIFTVKIWHWKISLAVKNIIYTISTVKDIFHYQTNISLHWPLFIIGPQTS